MKQLTINPNNRRFYSEDFIKGFECGTQRQLEADKADRQQGDVDAVAIFEHEMHNLEQGYITLGEFDERIEPLRHLCYGRPQGKWIKDNLGTVICSECKRPRRDSRVNHVNFCNSCGAHMKGANDVER